MMVRVHERKAVGLHAVVACPRFGMLRGMVTDLSLGGLYVSAETRIVPIGAEVSVTVALDPSSGEPALTLPGRVSHQSLQGFGIEFEGLDADSEARLCGYLSHRPATRAYAPPVLRAL
jgi:hypothetical protein